MRLSIAFTRGRCTTNFRSSMFSRTWFLLSLVAGIVLPGTVRGAIIPGLGSTGINRPNAALATFGEELIHHDLSVGILLLSSFHLAFPVIYGRRYDCRSSYSLSSYTRWHMSVPSHTGPPTRLRLSCDRK